MKKQIFLLLIFLIAGLVATAVFLNNEVYKSDNKLDNEDQEEVVEVGDLGDGSLSSEKDSEDSDQSNEIRDPVITERKVSRLDESPETIRAVYLTSGSVSRESKIQYVLDLVRDTQINSVVIDVNNFSGTLAYDSNLDFVDEYGIEVVQISDLKSLISRLHDEGVYTIARIVMFQDSALAKARPDLAVKSTGTSTVEIWEDSAGQSWLDPASREVWARKMSIASEVSSMGFDELNFDYIRFPSDGDLEKTRYSFWDPDTTRKSEVLTELFKFMRSSLPDDRISIDTFGLTTVNRGGLGIGQVLEETMKYFDVIAPMVYPSHYNDGSFGIEKPAEKPYEIVLVSLTNALIRMDELKSQHPDLSVKIRPWLQDFDLGADYGPDKVRAQIEATIDSLREDYSGFMLWNPRNIYTRDALINSFDQ